MVPLVVNFLMCANFYFSVWNWICSTIVIDGVGKRPGNGAVVIRGIGDIGRDGETLTTSNWDDIEEVTREIGTEVWPCGCGMVVEQIQKNYL